MNPGALQAAVTLFVAAALAGYVATRRERSAQQWLLLGLTVGVTLWSAGGLLESTALQPARARLGQLVWFFGASLVPPLWLLLAAQQARLPLAVHHLRSVTGLVLLPSALAFLALLSNGSHHLFYTVDVGPGATPSRMIDGAGPVFWTFAMWGQLCGLGGALLLVTAARRMRSQRRRRPALLLAAAALPPLASNALFLCQVVPGEQDPTPLALTLSLGLITAAIFRFGVLDGTLPLARRDVLEHLPEGLLVADADGVVLDINPAAARLLGRSDLRGRTLLDALLGVEWDAGADQLERALTLSDGCAPPVVTVLRSRDDRWIEMHSAVVQGRRGEPAGQYVVLHDRTEQRSYERFVHQSQKLETVGGMVAGIAHEVNNPLAYVRSNLNALLTLASCVERHLGAFEACEQEAIGEMRPILEETLEGVDRISRIVDGLRRYSRADADEALPLDLNAVARQAMRMAELHGSRDILVTAGLADTLPAVKGSADRLGQVVLNLLLNAKHALAGRPFGRITLETLARRGGVELHVSDNGPGIPEEIQARIFDPFFTTKGPDEGTGLGLTIAFEIVREHGGSIEIASSPGAGARFIIRLPST